MVLVHGLPKTATRAIAPLKTVSSEGLAGPARYLAAVAAALLLGVTGSSGSAFAAGVSHSIAAGEGTARSEAAFEQFAIDPHGPSRLSGTGVAGSHVTVMANGRELGGAVVGAAGRWRIALSGETSRALAGRDHVMQLLVRGNGASDERVADSLRIAVPGINGEGEAPKSFAAVLSGQGPIAEHSRFAGRLITVASTVEAREWQLPAGRVPQRRQASPDKMLLSQSAQNDASSSERSGYDDIGADILDATTQWLDRADRDFRDVMRKLSVREDGRLRAKARPRDGIEQRKRQGADSDDGRPAGKPPGGSLFSWDWLSESSEKYRALMRKLSRRREGDSETDVTGVETEEAARLVESLRRKAAERVTIDPGKRTSPDTDAELEAAIERRAESERTARERARLVEERRIERLAEKELRQQEDARQAAIRRRQRQEQQKLAAQKLAEERKSARLDREAADRAAERERKRQAAEAKTREAERERLAEVDRQNRSAAQRRVDAEAEAARIMAEDKAARAAVERASEARAADDRTRRQVEADLQRRQIADAKRRSAALQQERDQLRLAGRKAEQRRQENARRVRNQEAFDARRLVQERADQAARIASKAAADLAEEKRLTQERMAAAKERRRKLQVKIAEAQRATRQAREAKERALAARRLADERRRLAEERIKELQERRRLAQNRRAEKRAMAQAEKARRAAAETARARQVAEAASNDKERRDAERRLNFSLRDAEAAAASAIEAARSKLAEGASRARRIAQGLPPRREEQGSAAGGDENETGRRRFELSRSPEKSRAEKRRPEKRQSEPGQQRGEAPQLREAGQKLKGRLKGERCRQLAGRRIELPGWYVVGPGDTLWTIARRHYQAGSTHRLIYLANRNRIDDPDRIKPCLQVKLPLPEPAG